LIKLAQCQEIPPEQIERYYDLDSYFAQRKWNGVRAILSFNKLGEDNDYRIFNRNGVDLTEYLPEIIVGMEQLKNVPPNTIFDGELVCFTDRDWNNESFSNILKRTKMFNAEPDEHELVYFKAFDMPYLYGVKQKNENLVKRFNKIKRYIKHTSPHIQYVSIYQIAPLWVDCLKYGWEGIVLKRKNRGYIGTRTWDWIKVKPTYEMVVKVYGFERNELGIGFKSLYIAEPHNADPYEGDKLLGRCGQGFNEETTTTMCGILRKRTSRKFNKWVAVKPFNIKIKHYGYGDNGHLKNAIFVEIVE